MKDDGSQGSLGDGNLGIKKNKTMVPGKAVKGLSVTRPGVNKSGLKKLGSKD
jgi:hypothetical protein